MTVILHHAIVRFWQIVSSYFDMINWMPNDHCTEARRILDMTSVEVDQGCSLDIAWWRTFDIRSSICFISLVQIEMCLFIREQNISIESQKSRGKRDDQQRDRIAHRRATEWKWFNTIIQYFHCPSQIRGDDSPVRERVTIMFLWNCQLADVCIDSPSRHGKWCTTGVGKSQYEKALLSTWAPPFMLE